jgi:hypothetical protein
MNAAFRWAHVSRAPMMVTVVLRTDVPVDAAARATRHALRSQRRRLRLRAHAIRSRVRSPPLLRFRTALSAGGVPASVGNAIQMDRFTPVATIRLNLVSFDERGRLRASGAS